MGGSPSAGPGVACVVVMRRPGIAALAILAVASCSSAGPLSNGAAGSEPVTIAITELNGHIDPSGKTVTVDRGAPITLRVTSDTADEIHVHSVPEHEYEVTAGTPETFRLRIDTPGTYEVESHGLNVVIVKLQVS